MEVETISIYSALSETPTENTPLIRYKTLDDEKYVASYLGEFKWLIKNALPIVFTFLMQNSLQMASIFTLGHLVSFILLINQKKNTQIFILFFLFRVLQN